MARVCAVVVAVGFAVAMSLLPAVAQFSDSNPPWVGIPTVPKVPTASSTFNSGQNDPNAQMMVRADELPLVVRVGAAAFSMPKVLRMRVVSDRS